MRFSLAIRQTTPKRTRYLHPLQENTPFPRRNFDGNPYKTAQVMYPPQKATSLCDVGCRPDKAQRLFEAGLDNCPDNPFLLQAFAVMEEERGNQAKVRHSVVFDFGLCHACWRSWPLSVRSFSWNAAHDSTAVECLAVCVSTCLLVCYRCLPAVWVYLLPRSGCVLHIN